VFAASKSQRIAQHPNIAAFGVSPETEPRRKVRTKNSLRVHGVEIAQRTAEHPDMAAC
jgi:hypothetical protein